MLNLKNKSMKYFLKLNIALIGILIISWACAKIKQDPVDPVQEKITAQVEKIETLYTEGMYKYEGPTGEPKIVTFATRDLSEIIKKELKSQISKLETYQKSTVLVGVLSGDGDCGYYAKLEINMDCEDSTPESDTWGWTGASELTSDKNVILRFCIVYAEFGSIPYYEYALLRVTSDWIPDVNVINRYFDNEDHANGNWVLLDGESISGQWLDTEDEDGPNDFGGNTLLSFYHYPQASGAGFPILEINYGVLGKYGTNPLSTGWIETDDEDNRNWNYCHLWTYNSGDGTWSLDESPSIPNIMWLGGDTRIFMTSR